MKKFLKISTLCIGMMTLSNATVTISTTSLQGKIHLGENGQKIKKWLKADRVVPGTIIKYVNRLVNSGDKPAKRLVIKNPIPKNMRYLAYTAECETECKISYSVDHGRTFHTPKDLYIKEEEGERLARAYEYTDIMWEIEVLEAQSESSVEYKALLK